MRRTPAGLLRLAAGLALLLHVAAPRAEEAPRAPEPPAAEAPAGGEETPPVEDERPPALDTVYDDARVGGQEAEKVDAALGLVQDPALTAYLSAVGKRLARHAPRYRFDYTFRIIDQDEPNAFALPGGYVYVSRGLLALCNSEDELANVLGHEIAHVAARHAAARQQVAETLPGLVQFLSMGTLAGYSRSQEKEADRLGQGIAALAGYDPEGMAEFLRDLEFMERLKLGASRRPFFLDTHPSTVQRTAVATQRAKGIAWTRRPGVAKTPEDFLRHLEGLVVGISGAEGVFRGDRFLHADLGFTLRFPDGWETRNTRLAVGALARDRSAQVVLELAGKGSDLEKALQAFHEETEKSGLKLALPGEPIRVGGFEALRVDGSASSRFGGVRVLVTLIASRGNVYRITGVSRSDHETNRALFLNVARSFRPLSQELAESIQESRLRIVEARGGETLADLSSRTGNTWSLNHTAVMNDLFATDTLEHGRLVKVAVAQPYRPAR